VEESSWLSRLRQALPAIVLPIALLAAAYTAVAKTTSLKSAIGRRSPAIASMFSPREFNFTEQYTDGRVLEFAVGMSTGDVLSLLRTDYAGRGRLVRNCLIRTVKSLISITPDLPDVPGLDTADRLCVFADQHLVLIFSLTDAHVSSIEVSYVRNEA
jgi:hypothetical protein